MSKIKNISVPDPCPHLAEFKSKHATNNNNNSNPFMDLQFCVRARPMGRAAICRAEGEVPYCPSCYSRPHRRLYACITCAGVSCYVHARVHPHAIAVDVDRAELFCWHCGDQVYDPDFDAAVLAAAAPSSGDFLPLPPPLRKRRRVEFSPWEPGPTERALITENSTPAARPGSGPGGGPVLGPGAGLDYPLLGLRGLNNMGNTCFMNSVLQALVHTPPLRNYFLSDRHNRFFCMKRRNAIGVGNRKANGKAKGRKGNVNGNGNEDESGKVNLCLSCDLDALFSAVFSGDRRPFSPANLLYSWWQHAADLATYEQQDAHEFFISMLDGIHGKMKDQSKNPCQGLQDTSISEK